MRIATFTGAQRDGRHNHAGWVNFAISGPIAPEKLGRIQALPGVLDALTTTQDTTLMVFLVPTASDAVTEELSHALIEVISLLLGEAYTWERGEPSPPDDPMHLYRLVMDSDIMPPSPPVSSGRRRWLRDLPYTLFRGPLQMPLFRIKVWRLRRTRRKFPSRKHLD